MKPTNEDTAFEFSNQEIPFIELANREETPVESTNEEPRFIESTNQDEAHVDSANEDVAYIESTYESDYEEEKTHDPSDDSKHETRSNDTEDAEKLAGLCKAHGSCFRVTVSIFLPSWRFNFLSRRFMFLCYESSLYVASSVIFCESYIGN